MPSPEKWVAFLLVNLVAFVAAKNTVLRRERQLERKVYTEQLERLEAEQLVHTQWQQEQEQLLKGVLIVNGRKLSVSNGKYSLLSCAPRNGRRWGILNNRYNTFVQSHQLT